MVAKNIERCHCGRPLHYTHWKIERQVRQIIAFHGEFIKVTTSDDVTYRVQRHYIALHGLCERDLPNLGFEIVPKESHDTSHDNPHAA